MKIMSIYPTSFSIFIFLVCFFSNAHAVNWVKYGNDANGDDFYVDTDSTKKTGDIVIFSGLRDLAEPEKNFGSLSGTGKFKVDCAESKTMLLAYNFFSLNMGKGEIIAAIPIREKKWFYPPQNTIGNKQIQFICSFNKQI
jgi:hypothetical protein